MKLVSLVLAVLFPLVASAQVYNPPGTPVRTFSQQICVTPTVTAGAYSAGQVMGGKLTFTWAGRPMVGTGYVSQVMVFDKAASGTNKDLVIFNTNPASTITDNTTFDPDDADGAKLAGYISIDTHGSFNDNGLSQSTNKALAYDTGTSVSATYSLYGVLVARAATTPASSSDLIVCINVTQD